MVSGQTWNYYGNDTTAPAFYDFPDDDVEHLTCDVCDRAFPTLKQLAAHQRKKRHYG